MRKNTIQDFMRQILFHPTGCWIWTGTRSHYGYGRFHYDNKDWIGSVFAYNKFIGPVPEGLELDHLCRRRSCVNPDHLEPVTPRENTLRGETPAAFNLQKTHCKNGHPFDETNTYTRKRVRGGRTCRKCIAIWSKDYRLRKSVGLVDRARKAGL